MNDLAGSFARFRSDDVEQGGGGGGGNIQMGGGGTVVGVHVNLDKFFEDVESVKDELKQVERIHQKLSDANEKSKTSHNAKSIKEIRSPKLIKVRLEALDRANASNRSFPGCGPGSSSDCTRTSVVKGLRKKLIDSMNNFNSLREKISSEYKDTVKRIYYTVTGENPADSIVENLISTGESETFLQKAIQEQGRGRVLDIISEIQERHDAVKEVEKGLHDLHQVFLDMAVLVEVQGEQLDDIQSHVARANSFVRGGTEQLLTAKKHQKSTRKWTCYYCCCCCCC
ncbi:hypothetical protein MKW92_031864 [Papaver armeniacum]|nr:hypothetical protein MKW92_031864 [Papaver armeniacum]